jgi:DNA-binding transcriptional MerR regulator
MCYSCQVAHDLTIDELAAATGTTTRSIRSLQTMGLLAPPTLQGRTGLYDAAHAERLGAILRLQDRGFSLQSLVVLFAAYEEGDTLADVLGLPDEAGAVTTAAPEPDATELYGFADLLDARHGRRHQRRRPLLSVVPTTLWQETEAS